jgi:dolichol-phosphate mannosyltransferase
MLLDRRIVTALRAMPEKNSYLFGQVMWLGFRKDVVHYRREKRPRGTSAWTVAKKIKYFIDAFAAFSYLPLRAASVLGFLLAGAGLAYAALVVGLRLAGQVPPSGYTTLVVIVLVTAGAQLIMVGIMGEYLWRVLEEVRPRPPSVVAAAINVEEMTPSKGGSSVRDGVGRDTRAEREVG